MFQEFPGAWEFAILSGLLINWPILQYPAEILYTV